MRHIAAAAAAALLYTSTASAAGVSYKERTGAWMVIGSRVGHSVLECVMGRPIEVTEGGGTMFLYGLKALVQERKYTMSLALQTHFPAGSKPQAVISFPDGASYKLGGFVQGRATDTDRAVSIIVPNGTPGEALRNAFANGPTMTIELTLPAAASKPAQKESSTIPLDDVEDALTLERECLTDIAKGLE